MKILLPSLTIFLVVVFFTATDVFAQECTVVGSEGAEGPFAIEALKQMVADGKLTKETLLQCDGMDDFDYAENQLDLRGLFAESSLTPPDVPVAPPAVSQPPIPPTPSGQGGDTVAQDSGSVMAPSGVPEEEKEVTAFPDVDLLSDTKIRDQIDDWMQGKGKTLGDFDSKGTYFGSAIQAINADPERIDFGQKRITAFEKAFSKAKGEFVLFLRADNSVSVVTKKFFKDDEDLDGIEIKDGRAKGIANKIGALTEAKLDHALKELGVDPKDVENSDIRKKRVLMEDSIAKEMSVEAFQALAGVRIDATFEDVHNVGVVIKYNDNTRALADAIGSGELIEYPVKGDPKESISNQLKQRFKTDMDYLSQYGVRVMTDDSGNKALVSFGQWSPKVTKADSKMKRNMSVEAAKEIADSLARSYLTQFISTTVEVQKKDRIRDSDTVTEISKTDGAQLEKEAASVGSKLDKFIKENSEVKLEGVTPIKHWAVNHPKTGHMIFGKVLLWSPSSQEFARRGNLKKAPQFEKEKARVIKSRVYKSIDIGDEDF